MKVSAEAAIISRGHSRHRIGFSIALAEVAGIRPALTDAIQNALFQVGQRK